MTSSHQVAKDSPKPSPPPRIYKATLGTGGDVIRGEELTEHEAIDERIAGRDIVVCGQNTVDNRDLAQKVEKCAHGKCIHCAPHAMMGPGALPHYHPDPRSKAAGHGFYETSKMKSKKQKAGGTP